MTDYPIELIYIGSFVVTFFEAFVKSFQSRLIAQGHEWHAAITSVIVTLTIFSTLGFFHLAGWTTFITAAMGGSLGTFWSIRTHKLIYRSKVTHTSR